MNRRLVLLNLALLALAGALVWTLRTHWLTAKSRERAVLQRKVAAKAVMPPPPLPGVKAVAPADYIDVAGKMLFSKDRNPTVVVEPPKPAPEPVMPALPSYHGQMSIGEPVILLSMTANAVQRSYHVGEQIGDFKLVSFDEDRVAFEWKGKNVERKLEELRPKETTTQASTQTNPPPGVTSGRTAAPRAPAASTAAAPIPAVASLDHPAPAPAAAAASSTASSSATPAPARNVTALAGGTGNGSNSGTAGDTGGDSTFGPLLSSGDRACLPSDTSPVGTVHSGFIKVQSMGIFGASCSWTEVK